jgi:hypothetical protein
LGCGPADLDDLVQDAFVPIYRKPPEFEGRSNVEELQDQQRDLLTLADIGGLSIPALARVG